MNKENLQLILLGVIGFGMMLALVVVSLIPTLQQQGGGWMASRYKIGDKKIKR